MHLTIRELLERSHRLGADRRVTNFAGGNTSVKLTLDDPITGEPTRVLAVKGSGGDLGTLTEKGLALLDLDRVLALESTFHDGTPEDDLVPLYSYCAFGDSEAVPSIDTPLHAFVGAEHIDHLHPDSLIAFATAADGPDLVADAFGGELGWLDWVRPGFELGLLVRDFQRDNPDAVGAVLGGHGVICWADTSERCEVLSLRLVETGERYLAERGKDEPFGGHRRGYEALDAGERARAAAQLGPVIRRLASVDRRMVGSFTDAPVVLDFLASKEAPRLVALGTSCPDHFLRTKVKPLLLDLPRTASHDERVLRLNELHEAYRADYTAYYEDHADADSPPIRGADPAIVLVPGVGMWSFGADSQTARVAGEFYVNAINVMRGAESVSSYSPIPDVEKFRIEYWELEERKLTMKPPPPSLQGRVALVTGGASGIGLATAERLAENGACVVVADLDRDKAEKICAELGADGSLAATCDVGDEASVTAAFDAAARRFGGVDLVVNSAGFAHSAELVDSTVEEWDRLHDVLARGSYLVSREAARQMIAQRRGGDIVHIVSKNSVVAGPGNVAYSAAKADQAHQVRLLAAELGQHGIRVNGVNPDAVVSGSGIFSGEWLEQRAETYGVEPDKLGEFYAARTLLGKEVLPAHVAEAVCALVAGALERTTGHTIPVDGGLAAGFLR